jgi:sugar phosphate isomerase/epimerase
MRELLISINTLSLDPASFEEHVAIVKGLGATAISPDLADIEECGRARTVQLLRNATLTVATVTHRAFGFATPSAATAQRDRLKRTIEIAQEIGARSVCMTSGPRGELSWREAALRFVTELAPCVDYAKAAGVTLALEPTSHLYADASIVHRLADVVSLAHRAGISVGIDLFPCWMDSDIDSAIAAAGPLCALVQVSDYVLGDRGLPCRAVPGDGAVPLERLIRLILATGFRGPFDLEIIGPRLLAEGRKPGLRRAMARLAEMLERGLRACP